MLKFLIYMVEFLLLRPFLLRSRGQYEVIVVEYDAEMTAPFCYRYICADKCEPYVYKFNTYAEAINQWNNITENKVVPFESIKLTHKHLWKGRKEVLSLRW